MATIKELKYKSWNTLPIGKYEEIRDILRSGSEHMDVEILSVLCDCNLDTLLNMRIVDLTELKKQAMFITKPLKVKDRLMFNSIKIDGVKYNIFTDMRKVTTAQFIDFQTFYQDYEKNYCNILACFIIPEGHTYNDGYDAMELAELFREKLDVETAENVCFFFARRSERSYRKGLTSLIFQIAKMGIRTRTPQTKEIIQTLATQREHITGLGKLMKSLTQN